MKVKAAVTPKKLGVIFYARVKPETKHTIQSKAKAAGFGKGVGKFLDHLAKSIEISK